MKMRSEGDYTMGELLLYGIVPREKVGIIIEYNSCHSHTSARFLRLDLMIMSRTTKYHWFKARQRTRQYTYHSR